MARAPSPTPRRRRTPTTGHARSFTLTLTPADRARASALAKRDDRSLSSLVRLALKDYCDRAEELPLTKTGSVLDPGHDAGPWPRNPFDQHGRKA
jgi:hypothetical protein